jgi:hypothetical protein
MDYAVTILNDASDDGGDDDYDYDYDDKNQWTIQIFSRLLLVPIS